MIPTELHATRVLRACQSGLPGTVLSNSLYNPEDEAHRVPSGISHLETQMGTPRLSPLQLSPGLVTSNTTGRPSISETILGAQCCWLCLYGRTPWLFPIGIGKMATPGKVGDSGRLP